MQRSIQWYADTDFGIFSQWLTLLRVGLLGLSARKNTTKNLFYTNLYKKNYKLSATALENST